jgi:hypothetical protein
MSAARTWAAGRRFTRAAVALGLLLVVAAPVLRFWVTPALAQSAAVPGGGGFVTFTSAGTITTLFDLEVPDAPVVTEPIPVTRTISTHGDADASQAAVAQGLNVAVTDTIDRTVTKDGRLIAETSYRLASDRHSQALTDCCGAEVGGVTVSMGGAGSPLRLPWFPPTATYPYFDTALMTAVAMDFIGSERVADIEAMKFQQATAPTAVGTVPVPGALVGSDQTSVTLTRALTVNRTLWVDPTTGIILRTVERVRETLRDETGNDVVTLVVMSLASTPEQEASQVAAAHDQGRPVLWAHSYGPALCLVLGTVLVLVGVVGTGLRVRARRAEQDFPDEWASFDDLKEAFDQG